MSTLVPSAMSRTVTLVVMPLASTITVRRSEATRQLTNRRFTVPPSRSRTGSTQTTACLQLFQHGNSLNLDKEIWHCQRRYTDPCTRRRIGWKRFLQCAAHSIEVANGGVDNVEPQRHDVVQCASSGVHGQFEVA